MQVARVGDVRTELPLLVISGFGAHAVLADEVGLHVLESESGGARPGAAANRAVARVRVVPTPADGSSESAGFQKLAALLATQLPTSAVVRRYRFEPSPLVRDARKGWRAGRVADVMAGNFDLFAGESTR
jgi:ATP-dependent Clp protease ATP-binding subunit ClpC